MEEEVKSLVQAIERRDELQRVVDSLEVTLQLKQAQEDVERFRQAVIEGVASGAISTGQRKGTLNDKPLKITPKRGRTSVKITDIDLLPDEFRADTLEEDAICIDENTAYLKADESYYVKNNQVYKKQANEDLVKNRAKLGENIEGVQITVGRPSCVIEYDGVVL